MPQPSREIHQDLWGHEFTLDGIVLSPTRIPRFEPSNADPSTRLTERTILRNPIISSPMDRVTEAEMAILMARLGGVGVIHAGLSSEIQRREIEKVRRWKAGFVKNPAVLGPDATVRDVLKGELELGFSSYPITADGTLRSPMIGIITKRDFRDCRDDAHQGLPVTEIMTPQEKLVYGTESDSDANGLEAANEILRSNHLDTLPILDNEGRVVALVTRSDLDKDAKYPLATTDSNKQLKVYAAVESRPERAFARIEEIANTGISGIVIDSRNVYGGYLEIAKYAKDLNRDLDVIIGNIVHPDVLRAIQEEGGFNFVDAFRVGIGTGEVCSTTEGLGIGRAMGSSLVELDQAYTEINVNNRYGYKGFIADGGIKSPKHFLAAAVLNRYFGGIMMGTVLAGYDESPGVKTISGGIEVKDIRGMGSAEAIKERAGGNRYGVDQTDPELRYAEGESRKIRAVGPGESHIKRFMVGVTTGMHALGARNLSELYENVKIYPAVQAATKGTITS
jgi:IMP dehydrogenase